MDTSTPTKIDPAEFTPASSSDRIKINPKDFITGKGEAALVGVGVKEVGKRVGRALSTPEKVLRTVPPVAMQAAGAIGGGYVGGEPGAVAGGAAASVLTDFYDRFLNYMYGVPNKPISLGHEALSAVMGGATSEAPEGAEAVSGLRGARKIATEAAAKSETEQAGVLGKIAERQTAAGEKLATAKAGAAADLAQKKLEAGQDALAKSAEASKKIQGVIDDTKAKLRQFKGKELEKARQEAAPQVATKQIQGMMGKNPQQLAKQEAMTSGPEFARVRSQAIGPVFDGAQAYHEEVGKLFDPYIGKNKDKRITGEALDQISSKIAGIKSIAAERGQNINDPELNKVFGRLEEASKPPDTSELTRILAGKGATSGAVQLSNADLERLEAAKMGKGVDPLTVGEAWGLRSRLGAILSKSNNPAVRLAAHEGMDQLTEVMPDIPAGVRQQYATQRSLYPQKLMREVAQARNPAEVGQAIFGTPTTPEPAQVALNLIRRAKTPEAQDGLRTAFADNWLSKPHNPEDINRFNPEVIKSLYGKDADAVFKLLGPEGNFKSASWQKLIATSPEAKAAFDKAYQDTIKSETGKALKEAISKGEQALRDQPDKFAAYQAAIKDIKAPEDKIKALEKALNEAGQPTEKEAQTLARTPQKAAVEALGKRGFAPDSRLERMALAGLAFRAYFSLAGAGGAIARHPELAVGAGVLLGGRGVIRSALSYPAIAEQYVKMLGIGATKSNAPVIAHVLAQITAASALQYVKDGSNDASVTSASRP